MARPTWGPLAAATRGGSSGIDEHVWNLTLDRDGKIVAAGDAVTASGGFDVALARFNSDGMLDTSFGTGGKVTTAIGPGSRRDRAHDVAVLNDGKIVVAGFADMGPDAGRRHFMLARYNPDGPSTARSEAAASSSLVSLRATTTMSPRRTA